MATLNPYLNFNGNCEEAFNFYKTVFGGDFTNIMRFKDMPPGEGGTDQIPQENEHQIMHISLPIGDGILMGSDCLETFGQKAIFGSSNYISFTPDSQEQARNIFEKLSADGEVEMPLEEMFWGDLFASFTDKFGIKWMISFPIDQS